MNPLYLVSRTGPTNFILRDDNDNTFRTTLGNPHKCSCSEFAKDSFCIHLLFSLTKVLRIPHENPMAWQKALIDAEITQILDGIHTQENQRARRIANRVKSVVAEDNKAQSDCSKNNVHRQELLNDENDICPICQDLMKSSQPLSWCRIGCGNNMHAKCMSLYAQHKVSTKALILCPLCRLDWGPGALHTIRDDLKVKSSSKVVATSMVFCGSCSLPARCDFFRCIECSQIKSFAGDRGLQGSAPSVNAQNATPYADFCPRCFKDVGLDHLTHHFLKSDASKSYDESEWEAVKNPRYAFYLNPNQCACTLFIFHLLHLRSCFASCDPSVIHSLQSRELSNSDYDLLLGLDSRDQLSLDSVIIKALPLMLETSNSACWCGDKSGDRTLRILPCCRKACHDVCLSSLISDCISVGSIQIENAKCLHIGCRQTIFKGLSRKKRKKKITIAAARYSLESVYVQVLYLI